VRIVLLALAEELSRPRPESKDEAQFDPESWLCRGAG
jgi:hypothetical protein